MPYSCVSHSCWSMAESMVFIFFSTESFDAFLPVFMDSPNFSHSRHGAGGGLCMFSHIWHSFLASDLLKGVFF